MNYKFLELVHIKPKDGTRVLEPLSMKVLPPEGMKLDYNPYWARRALEGDVIITALKKEKGAGK